MKLGPKLRLAGLTLFAMGAIAVANAALTFSTGTGFLPGFRLIDGSDLNVIVTALNNITGGGSAAPVTATTLTATSVTVTGTGASALAVGAAGATNPAFQVDASTASQAAGLKVTGAVTGGTVAVAAVDAGAATNLTLNAKGTGTIGIGSVSTGAVTITPATTVTAALTPAGGIAATGGGPAVARGQNTCNQGGISTTTPGTDTTPVNTETYIAEVYVDGNETITGVAVFNGSAVAGNVKVSLANATTGAPIAAAQTASTAQSGTAAYQLINFVTPYAAVGPATYLVLVQFDTNTTPRFRTHAIGTCGASKKTGETYGTFTTVTPPTTFTTAVGPMVALF